MQLTVISQNMATKIDAAIASLRRGSLIMIRDQNQRAGFAQAAEFADFDLQEIPILKRIAPTLCFTKQHVEYLRPDTSSDRPVFSLTANTLTKTQILGLAIGESQLLPENAALLPEHSNSLADLAVRVVKFAKLLPSALLYRLPKIDNYNQERLLFENGEVVFDDGVPVLTTFDREYNYALKLYNLKLEINSKKKANFIENTYISVLIIIVFSLLFYIFQQSKKHESLKVDSKILSAVN